MALSLSTAPVVSCLPRQHTKQIQTARLCMRRGISWKEDGKLVEFKDKGRYRASTADLAPQLLLSFCPCCISPTQLSCLHMVGSKSPLIQGDLRGKKVSFFQI